MEEVNEFKEKFLSRAYLQMHVEGNFTQDEANAMFNYATTYFNPISGKVPKNELPRIRKIKIPMGVKVENFNERSPMSYTVLCWQFGRIKTVKTAAL